MQHLAVHMTAGGLAGAPVPTPGMGLGYLCRRSLLSRIEVAVCARSLSSSAVLLVRALMHALLLVRALMHAPPRVKSVSAASRQCSRQLASLSLFTSTTLQLWGTEALLDWLLRHRSRQSKRGDNVPIKILALFISKSLRCLSANPRRCSAASSLRK